MFHLSRVILPWLVQFSVATVFAGTEDPIGPIINWTLQKMPQSATSKADKLPHRISLKTQEALQFSVDRPHAICLSGEQNPFQVQLDHGQFADLPTKNMSLQIWVRPEKNQTKFSLVCLKQNGRNAWSLGGGPDHFSFTLASKARPRSTEIVARPFYQDAQWYQVTATYDGQQQKIFVDGKLAGVAFEQRGDLLPIDSPKIQIGTLYGKNQNQKGKTCFSGQIANIRVWNRTLTESEIKSQFLNEQAMFPGALATYNLSRDWPTFGHDNHRSRRAGSQPALPLHLAWHRRIHPGPQPAWPPPAQQDFWNRKQNLKPRVGFDRCFEPVVANGKVYLGSSSDDQLYCFDLASGEKLWNFSVEAPIRLAPTVADDKVLFGSDDGGVYCLDAETGHEIWRYKPTANYFPGNGRLVHPQLVRSGIFVEHGKAWFTAGLFPRQGVYLVALDLRDGAILKKTNLSRSPQGYLGRVGGRLYAPTGRNLRGAILELLESEDKDPVIERPQLLPPLDRTAIEAGQLIFAGGTGTVAALSLDEQKLLWDVEIEGTAGSLVLADDHLLVSTEEGDLYCFTPQKQAIKEYSIETGARQKYDPDDQTAKTILTTTGIGQGYGLVLGDDLSDLAIQIGLQTDVQVILGMHDAKKIKQVRDTLLQMNLYGQVTVHDLADKKTLPYTSWLFNVVVVEDAEGDTLPYDLDDIWRVVRPSGGCLWDLQQMRPTYREPLEGAGQWTHLYGNFGNTACSGDQLVQGALVPQWFGLPGPQGMIDRHHRTAAPLYRDGTLYIPGNEKIFGVDAYNGTVRFETAIPGSRRIGVLRDCGPMCAGKDGLFVAVGQQCILLSALDGKQRHHFVVPPAEDNQAREWGLVACDDTLLFGSSVPQGGIRRGHSRASIIEGTHWDFRPIVTSDSLFAFDQDSQKLAWRYAPSNRLILNPTIALGGGRMYFVELHKVDPQKTPGRVRIDQALDNGVRVVALDQQTGAVVWKREADYAAIEHHLYGFYADELYITVGSRNQAGDSGKQTVWYDIHVRDASGGQTKWETSQDNQTKAGGDHGEQDHHPLIVKDRLYVEPFAYDLNTGQRDYDWGWQRGHRGGCGTISASNRAFFFRDRNAAMFDLKSKSHMPVTEVSRPGCWINMIPAGGLLLIPEASSGCTCHYAVQASMAMRPSGEKADLE